MCPSSLDQKPKQQQQQQQQQPPNKKMSNIVRYQQEANDKYRKVVHESTKTLRRAVKKCKSFECQQIIKEISLLKKKSENEIDSSDEILNDDETKLKSVDDNDEKISSKMTNIKSLEEKLRYTRSFALNEIVNVCLGRLGIDTSGDPDTTKGEENKKDNNGNKIQGFQKLENSDQERNDLQLRSELVESILQNKKVLDVTESINSSILEYNRWLAKREKHVQSSSQNNDRRKRKMNSNVEMFGHDGDSGLFIDSLAGGCIDDANENDEGKANSDMYTDFAPTKKRNRMGQRQRKARALALEAKKGGTVCDDKVKEWWELNPKNVRKEISKMNELASGLDASKEIKAAEVVGMGKSWKEEGKAHPSWAARQVQQGKSGSGIGKIEFQGKKTTFD